MKKIISMVLTAAFFFVSTAVVHADETSSIKVEGESLKSSSSYTIVTDSGMSGGSAVCFSDTAEAEYTFNAPQSGAYSLKISSSELLGTNTTDFYVSVNGKSYIFPEEVKKISDISYSGLPTFADYEYPNVNLKIGENKIKIYVDGADKVNSSSCAAYIDCFEFTKATVGFAPQKIDIEKNCFYSSENISIPVLFSGFAANDVKYCYIAENSDGVPTRMGSFNILSGSDTGTIDLTGISNGWYRIKIYTLNFESDTGVEEKISVENELTAETPFAAEMAGNDLVAGMGKFRKLEGAMAKAGISSMRDRASIQGRNQKNYNFADVYESDNISITSMHDKTLSRGMDFKEDLIELYNKSAELSRNGKEDETYEIMNEADGGYAASTADLYAAYFKASAIGISDGMTTAKKGFAGIAFEADSSFSSLMFQNDILKYSDFYNYHQHHQYDPYSSYDSVNKQNIASHATAKNAYSDNLPMYMTEAGFTIADSRYSDAARAAQAGFFATQLSQVNSLGGDRIYFFTVPYYREGANTFGVFDENNMPEPVYSSIAAAADILKGAKYKGVLANLPSGAEGYMYSDGENDVAVIYGADGKTWSCYSSSNLDVFDYQGRQSTAIFTSHKIANVKLSKLPTFIRFSGESDERNYYIDNSEENITAPKEYSAADRIVVRQIWEDQDLEEAKSKGYTVRGEENVTIEVYNLGETDVYVDLAFETSGNFSVDSSEIGMTVLPMDKSTFKLKVTPNFDCIFGEKGYLKVSGVNYDDGCEISPSVAKMHRDTSESVKEQTVWFSEAAEASNWDTRNMSPGTSGIITQSGSDAVEITLDMTSVSGDGYAYPRCYLSNDYDLADTNGFCFDVEFDSAYSGAKTDVFIYTSEGAYHLNEYIPITAGKRTFFVNWDDLSRYTGEGALIPQHIKSISVGIQGGGNVPSYTVSNIGAYHSNEYVEKAKTVEFENVEADVHYKSLDKITVLMPSTSYQRVKVTLNGREYKDITSDDSGRFTTSVGKLERGVYTFQISGFDKMNNVDTKSVRFYVE